MTNKLKQQGFTLIEIAIVLLIVAIILGYTVAMLPIQQELKQYREADREMKEIVQHLLAYAQVNGRLPCPDVDIDNDADVIDSDGVENSEDVENNILADGNPDGLTDSCTAYYGFLPNQTLGIFGKINSRGNLIDPWGSPYRYAVSDIDRNFDNDATTFAGADLVTPGGVRQEGLSNVIPDIFICNNSDADDDEDNDGCTGSDPTPTDPVIGTQVAPNVAAVVISLGKDFETDSDIQNENLDDFYNGGADGDDGTNDKVYIATSQSNSAGSEFDDVVKWIPYTLLYSKMIAAGQLP